MRSMVWIIFTFFAVNSFAQGQYIATNAKLVRVGNTSGNGESFWEVATEGAGPCITTDVQTNIYFPVQSATSEKIFDRAYSIALAAVASGKRVNIYNYVDDSCNTAVGIELVSD